MKQSTSNPRIVSKALMRRIKGDAQLPALIAKLRPAREQRLAA